MRRPHALLAASATLALAAGPAVTTASAATPPAAAKSAALGFQHALGKGQGSTACSRLTTSAVKVIRDQLQKPSSASCASLIPAYAKFVKRSFGVSTTKLASATFKVTQGEGSSKGWYITTNAATTVVAKSGGTWKVIAPIAVG